ncbi:MAG: TetR/AcrR family transcriptional regulator [Clostridiales Family XIII bacterium]|jgi:AcrR family transcriptional regulator|nr:TetR/AcrR family transcriptional regulator [Clostridiales Family XIII bacterium]
MEKKTDLRITKTHMALCSAFTELLGEKRFEDITVNELCERSMVRRATFYKHFNDKYDFFGFFIREMQAEFAEKIVPYESADIPSKHFVGLAEQFIDFLEENNRIVQRILKSDKLTEMLNIFSEQVMRYTKQKLDEDIEKGQELLVSPDLLAACYSGAMLHMLLWWYTQKDPIPKDELLKQMATIINIVGSGVLP